MGTRPTLNASVRQVGAESRVCANKSTALCYHRASAFYVRRHTGTIHGAPSNDGAPALCTDGTVAMIWTLP